MAMRESRAARRKRLLEAAAAVKVPTECDVIVVGGGAAGLVAAIVAAEAGASVAVLERDPECGRSILATGNGRCNFANAHLDPRRYNDPAFVGAVCGAAWLDDVLDFFEESGLRWCAEEDRLYPLSRQAASVRNVLLARARRAGVILAPAREFHDVVWIRREWLGTLDPAVHYDPCRSTREPAGMAEVSHSLPLSDGLVLPGARAVVLASGGEALPFVGNLGLRTNPRVPVLCPLACRHSPLADLDGRRVHARASLTKAGSSQPVWHEDGEVLFRRYGLSGIVVFDLSRRVEAGDLVELDLAPGVDKAELTRLVDPKGQGTIAKGALDGVLDPVAAAKLEALAAQLWGVEWPGRAAAHTSAETLVALVKALPLVVEGPTDAEHAQVMRGGLANEQFEPATLASREHPWLFACGEALDVDADCGGFNLAWAWKSGMVAGAAAAAFALA